jgi:hypothetical protein
MVEREASKLPPPLISSNERARFSRGFRMRGLNVLAVGAQSVMTFNMGFCDVFADALLAVFAPSRAAIRVIHLNEGVDRRR